MSHRNDPRELEPAPATAAPLAETETASADETPTGRRRPWIAAAALLLALTAAGAGLAAWKKDALAAADAAAANQPEPMEAVAVAFARAHQHRPTTTAIGTVLATRSVALRNELPGTVREVALHPGEVVAAGQVLVRLDVSVEEAELAAQRARASLAESLLGRNRQASETRAVAESEVDRARAERDIALAEIARTQAIIERKTLRAPFRARVGLADLHRGQYLDEGTVLTTLQGIDEAAHVDFAVPQRVAAALRSGDPIQVRLGPDAEPLAGTIVAVDARVDPTTRNATVRARIATSVEGPAPGASVRVEVPDGPPRSAVVVPASALRKGPSGDHVFVIAPDAAGKTRAQLRAVQSGAALGEDVLIVAGLAAGERVAAAGSFKLRDAVLVAVAETATTAAVGGAK